MALPEVQCAAAGFVRETSGSVERRLPRVTVILDFNGLAGWI